MDAAPAGTDVTGTGAAGAGGVANALDMMAALNEIYGTVTAPRTCTVRSGDGPPDTWSGAAAHSSQKAGPANPAEPPRQSNRDTRRPAVTT